MNYIKFGPYLKMPSTSIWSFQTCSHEDYPKREQTVEKIASPHPCICYQLPTITKPEHQTDQPVLEFILVKHYFSWGVTDNIMRLTLFNNAFHLRLKFPDLQTAIVETNQKRVKNRQKHEVSNLSAYAKTHQLWSSSWLNQPFFPWKKAWWLTEMDDFPCYIGDMTNERIAMTFLFTSVQTKSIFNYQVLTTGTSAP